MADNESIRNGDNTLFTGALKELSDGAKGPKVTLLDGSTSPVGISPATSGGQATNTAAIGATNEAAAGTDTATAGLNGLFKRYLQRFTTFLALLPASLGPKTKAASFSVTRASDEGQVTLTNRSGSITTGGTAQNAMASNASRAGFETQNLSSGDLWISTIATAVQDQPSMRIGPGQLYETPAHRVSTGAVSIIGATTGQKFYAREW